MASKYIKKFKVPNGFENILSDFAKEILRNQPKDILQFGIEYFKGLETNTKIDYKNKGENRPENYKRPENQKPNIINAQNNLGMSYEDRNRLQRSMDKIERINGEPAQGYEYGRPDFEHGSHGGPHGGPHGRPEYDHGPHGGPHGEPEFGHGSHGQDEYERGRHIAKYEKEEHHDRKIEHNEGEGHRIEIREETHVSKQVTVIKNGEVVREESSSHKFVKKFDENKQNLPGEGRHPPGRYNNLDEQEKEEPKQKYDDWFTKHSMDKQAANYKPENEPLDENLKRNEVGYNTWFNNHSVKSDDKNKSNDFNKSDEDENIKRIIGEARDVNAFPVYTQKTPIKLNTKDNPTENDSICIKNDSNSVNGI